MAERIRRGQPRAHWLVVALLFLLLAACLTIEGYTHGALGESAGNEPAGGGHAQQVPASIQNGGPVLDLTGSHPRSLPIPSRTAVLTFDDGPDPLWTPSVLAVLRRYHVHATFFTVGAHVAEYGGLVRQELRDGNEVGSHTYSHLDLATSGWRGQLELKLTQNALAGAAGIHTGLMRPPYSSQPNALTGLDWGAATWIGHDGYVVVLTSLDTADWSRPGVARIVAAAMPSGNQGAVIMMHDGGGNRSETVAALPRIIQGLRARGYRFATVTGAVGLPFSDVPATRSQRLIGLALVAAQLSANTAAVWLTLLLLLAGILVTVRLCLLTGFAYAHRRMRRAKASRSRNGLIPQPVPPLATGVSLVIPAYNEAANIAATVRSVVRCSIPGDLEVVVVDDGSTDGTAAIVRGLGLPGVRVIGQPNAGKPAALNRGIAETAHDIVVLMDGDTVFQPNTLERLIAPFADPSVAAVSGNAKVANRHGLLGSWQHIEYVIGFNLDRRLFDILGCMPTVPGAIGAFRRDVLVAVGGVSADTLAEDTDLSMALCRDGYRLVYEESAIAWTEVPSSLRQLWRQRYRWCFGTLQAMWKHRRSIADRGASGRFGRRCLTYLALFHVLLPLIAPIMDVFTIYGMVFISPVKVAVLLLAFITLQMITDVYAFRLDGERLRPLWTLPLQQIVYRQLLYLVTIQSVITALLGVRQRWQVVQRTGALSAEQVIPEPTGGRFAG